MPVRGGRVLRRMLSSIFEFEGSLKWKHFYFLGVLTQPQLLLEFGLASLSRLDVLARQGKPRVEDRAFHGIIRDKRGLKGSGLEGVKVRWPTSTCSLVLLRETVDGLGEAFTQVELAGGSLLLVGKLH